MTSPFGRLRVRIDPWEVEYGEQTPLSPTDNERTAEVDLDVELAASDWHAVTPPSDITPRQRVVFIDGVRRLEARLVAREGEQLIYGGFGSYAVGAVEIQNSLASFGPVRVFRVVVLGAGNRLPQPVLVRSDLKYEPESTLSVELDSALNHIQKAMGVEEAHLARDLSRPDTLTVLDGRLSFGSDPRGVAVGYVKRVHELYVPTKFVPLIATLPAAARTPIFGIRTAKSGFDRYSWFQRLAEPAPGVTEMHGIVRLEVASSIGIGAARDLANIATTWLPRTAPRRARDPRAPQNLLPIGALEKKLRTALGDARLFRRWIEAYVAKEALND